MKKIILLAMCISFSGLMMKTKAQVAVASTSVTSYYTVVMNRDELTISVKVQPGKNKTDAATIYWKITNKINKPIFLEGNYQVTGNPTSATSSYGKPLGKNKGGGSLPASKVESNSTQEFQSAAEWLNSVNGMTVTLMVIHKGDNVSSGNGN
jgi:hypothetical protein